MKTWNFSLPMMIPMALLMACGTTEKNGGAGEIPVAMACPADQNAGQGCPSPSIPAVPPDELPTRADNKQAAALKMKTKTKSIEGRCELRVAGDKKARSCSEVKVMVRSLEKGEMRDGEVDGFAIKFNDLNEPRYSVIATSEDYVLTSTPAQAVPGKRILVKIFAKPRKH